MNLLQLQNGFKQYGAKILFQDVALAINEGEHIGVIGPNGAGKTTLFKILVGQEHLDSGEIVKTQRLRIGYLEQEAEWSLDTSAEEYLEQNSLKPIWEVKRIGRDLGLTEDHFRSPLKSLSGGYRMRMKLLALIGQEPQLMLLDEPTNFLDLESVLALEDFLRSYKGAFMLISHDREFLRKTTESTVEVEGGDISKFPGHIDDYFEQKEQLKLMLEAQAANLEQKRKHLQSFVDRFRAKATKAKQAQSRVKQLEKMETVDLKPLPVRSRIKIPPPIHTGKETVLIENAEFGYPGKAILRNVNLRLERGVRLGVVGYNGAGKSTLLKSIAERLPLIAGSMKYGYQVTSSYFAQHVTEELQIEDTVLESLQKAAQAELKAQDILNMAGSLLFSGDDIYKKIKVLSGGEKSRVALGQILLRRRPFLIMDEPTNHLDFDTVEAMTEALREFEGTLIVVSHDRGFIRRVATKILEIRDNRAEIYPGTYDDYVWSLEQARLREQENAGDIEKSTNKFTASSKEAGEPNQEKFNYKEVTKTLQAEIRELQRKMTKCEELIFNLSKKRDSLTNDLLQARGPQAQELSKELKNCSNEIARIEDDFLVHAEKQEQLENKLKAIRGP